MNKLGFANRDNTKLVDIYLFAGFRVWVLINYDNIIKLVKLYYKSCFNVIVRLIIYFSIKANLSG